MVAKKKPQANAQDIFMVLGVGVEPTKAEAGRFTVWCVWPLRYPSECLYKQKIEHAAAVDDVFHLIVAGGADDELLHFAAVARITFGWQVWN